eukprot:SAG11_NODE_31_length_23119_cov_102.800608_9_plen_646_part_00
MTRHLGIPHEFKEELPKALHAWAKADRAAAKKYNMEEKEMDKAEEKMLKKLETDRKPMERRMLNLEGTKLSQGVLEIWVDIYTIADAARNKAFDITAPPGVPFEMRVIIWKTRDIPAMDEWTNSSDLYVTGELEWSDSNRKRQSLKYQTDTHWFCDDGAAVFNWRFIFKVPLPVNKPTFSIAAYDRDPLSFSSELVGDCSPMAIDNKLFEPVLKKFKKYGESEMMMVSHKWPDQDDDDLDTINLRKDGRVTKWIKVSKRPRNEKEAQRFAKNKAGPGPKRALVFGFFALTILGGIYYWEKMMCNPCSDQNLAPAEDGSESSVTVGGCSSIRDLLMLILGGLFGVQNALSVLAVVSSYCIKRSSGQVKTGAIGEIINYLNFLFKSWLNLMCPKKFPKPLPPDFVSLPALFFFLYYGAWTGFMGYVALQGNTCMSSTMSVLLTDTSDLEVDTTTCAATVPKATLELLEMDSMTECSSVIVEICNANATYWSAGWADDAEARVIPACNITEEFAEYAELAAAGVQEVCTSATGAEIFEEACLYGTAAAQAAGTSFPMDGIDVTDQEYQKAACSACAAGLATCSGCEIDNPTFIIYMVYAIAGLMVLNMYLALRSHVGVLNASRSAYFFIFPALCLRKTLKKAKILTCR